MQESKTGRPLTIPCGAPLRQALDQAPRRLPVILTNLSGTPWTADGFRTVGRETMKRAGITGKAFTDLRGTAVSRLKAAERTLPMIAGISGHTNAEVNAILDRHYLARRSILAREAIRRLETRTRTPIRFPKRSDESDL